MSSIYQIARIGQPILKQTAQNIEPHEIGSVSGIVEKMLRTLDAEGERIGLAAPQVFLGKRLFIYRIPKRTHSRYQTEDIEEIPLTAVINPVIRPLTEEKVVGWEACISVPNLMGKVERYKAVEMNFTNMNGENCTIVASGFHARVLQHEYDHLDGIVYPMRMSDMSTLGVENEILSSLSLQEDDVI